MNLRLRVLTDWYGQHLRVAAALTLAVVAVLIIATFRLLGGGDVSYFTADVEQGDVIATVEATGTIGAVTTVQVGSQVSGQIAALFADFNSRVQKGELIAQIDPAPFRARVLQAEADLASAEAGVKSSEGDLKVAQANREKSRAALHEAELNRSRTLELVEQGIASVQQRDAIEVAYETALANQRTAEAQIAQTEARVEQAMAQVKQRQAQVEQTRLDLKNTFIYAPIDGTVIARNVDVGQTVAASLQAPTLFTIAQDLTQMLVYAKTDESDVGRIRVDADAAFKVDSFPEETFRGRVKQVRMNAYQVENVVTYDTIIEFANPQLKLLPGMTAYVTIPVASANDVVKIPNGALRFTPDLPQEERRALLEKYGLMRAAATAAGEGAVRAQEAGEQERAQARARWQAQGGAASGPSGGLTGPSESPGGEGAYQIVWKLNPGNRLQPLRVKSGVTDFAFTAMLEGELKPSDKLVIGQTASRSESSLTRMPRRF
jgi:HlyD family secretion protein